MQRDIDIFKLIQGERERQERGIELIVSENSVSDQVMEVASSIPTNKYVEGYLGRRYYGGCEVADEIEQIAIGRAKLLFGAEYANVQSYSGSQANASVYAACPKPGDKTSGFDLSHGGYLTHGSSVNFSGRLCEPVSYGIEKETGLLNYDKILEIAERKKPQMIVTRASAYSRDIDFKYSREIANRVGALLFADTAHPAGPIAKGLLSDPIPYYHIVTTTTHKTLRGPRRGLILMGKDFENPFGLKTPKDEVRMMSSLLDSSVFPGNQGDPLEHAAAAKAVAFGKVLSGDFLHHVIQIQKNTRRLASILLGKGYDIISKSIDNHLMLIDLCNKDISGKEAEITLGKADITVNRNMVPFDIRSPFITSGIRVGVVTITTRGLKENDMERIAGFINRAIINHTNDEVLEEIAEEVDLFMEDRLLFAY